MKIAEIATVTLMRGEHELVTKLMANLEIFQERHVVDTNDGECYQPIDPSVIVHHTPLAYGLPFDAARSSAISHVKAPWILIVDTDEIIPVSLAEYLQRKVIELEGNGYDAVWIPRRNYVLGKPLQYSSSWPDYQLRLLRTDKAKFSDRVHSGIVPPTHTKFLDPIDTFAIQHFNFTSTTEFVQKINLYTSLEGLDFTGKTASISRAVRAGLREFVARYFKMRGYKDKSRGLHFALLMAFYRYLSVAKSWEREGCSP